MYERLLKKFRNEIGEKENKYIEIKQQKEEAKQDDTEKVKSIVQDFLSLNKPTSEIMKVIINRIEIHQDKEVDLYFNFKQLNNFFERCKSDIKEYSQAIIYYISGMTDKYAVQMYNKIISF